MIIAALQWGGDYCFCQAVQGGQADTTRIVLHGIKNPVAVSCAPSGMFFVLDRGTNEVLKYSSGGSLLARTGGFGGGDDGFDSPSDINALSDLQLLVADYGNNRILIYDGRLNRTETVPADLSGTGERAFGYPKSVAADRYGAMYVIDGENTRIVKIDASRKVERTIGGPEAGKGKLVSPSRIRVSDDDHVYVIDGGRLVMFDIFGNYLQSVSVADSGKPALALVLGTPFVTMGDTLRSLAGDLSMPVPGVPASGNVRDVSASGDWIVVLRDSTIDKVRLPGVIERGKAPPDRH